MRSTSRPIRLQPTGASIEGVERWACALATLPSVFANTTPIATTPEPTTA